MIRRRILLVSLVLLLVTATHWLTPTGPLGLHALHIVMRKLFILPIVLAAVWFSFRGALLTVAIATILYLPHVALQWSGQAVENINQLGELASLWIVALLAGYFMHQEKLALNELARSNEGALLALVGAMDARKQKRKYHARRVCAYAMRVARQMGLSTRALEVLGQVSVLHDLGMIGVPDEIILRAGPLDEQQWQMIERHPLVGYYILNRMPFLQEAAQIVKAHHEKYDGRGYPCGLVGDNIPLLARVFAVADAFDALTTPRRYARTHSFAEARTVIAKDARTHFDPKVVDAFLAVSDAQWHRILQELESGTRSDAAPTHADALEAELID